MEEVDRAVAVDLVVVAVADPVEVAVVVDVGRGAVVVVS
jgi:hypothetical protein